MNRRQARASGSAMLAVIILIAVLSIFATIAFDRIFADQRSATRAQWRLDVEALAISGVELMSWAVRHPDYREEPLLEADAIRLGEGEFSVIAERRDERWTVRSTGFLPSEDEARYAMSIIATLTTDGRVIAIEEVAR